VVLARTESPATLLEEVAARVDTIQEPQQQRNISACAEILPGLKFDRALIRRFLREELMRESVVYQEILQAGLQQGLDPDAAMENWEQEVFAPNLVTARQRCQNIANAVGLTEVLNVTQKTQTLNRSGNYRFICWFQSEVGGSPDADNNSP